MPPRHETRPPKAVLVIRLGAIGDVLLAYPLIRGLAARFPESRIDFLTKEAYIELLRPHPALNRVIGFPAGGGFRGLIETLRLIRGLRYDAVIDIQNNIRSRIFTFFSGAPDRRTVLICRFRRFLLVRFRMGRGRRRSRTA
jgi:ADP-heptose:LPS heptosyltransferase